MMMQASNALFVFLFGLTMSAVEADQNTGRAWRRLAQTDVEAACASLSFDLYIGVILVPQFLSPSEDQVVGVGVDTFLPGAEYDMATIQEACISVTLSDEEYDVVDHHRAVLILWWMLCYLEVPVTERMKLWAIKEIMGTRQSEVGSCPPSQGEQETWHAGNYGHAVVASRIGRIKVQYWSRASWT